MTMMMTASDDSTTRRRSPRPNSSSFPWWSLLLLLLLCLVLSAATAVDIHHSNATISRIVFGSCHNARKIHGTVYHNNIWKAMAKENTDVFVWTGDAVYPAQRKIANTTYLKQLLDDMRTNGTIGYKQFLEGMMMKKEQGSAVYGAYDDHDWGSGNDAGVEMPDKRERADLFLEFLQIDQGIPSSIQQREGLYYSVTFGDSSSTQQQQVKLIVLDTRWHRSKHCLPSLATKVPLGAGLSAATRWALAGFNMNRWWPLWDCWKEPTVLGEAQWQWLQEELDPNKSQASVHVVVSSIQVLTTDPTVESWGHFPLERQRLLRILGRGVSGLILLSGDVHHAEIFNPLQQQQAIQSSASSSKHSFLEVTSSGMTHYCSQPFYGKLCEPILQHYNQNRFPTVDNTHKSNTQKKDYYIGRNYGRIDIDWQRQTAEVLVQNELGETVLRTGHRRFQQDVLTDQDVARVPWCVDGHLIAPVLSVLTALTVIAVAGFLSLGRQSGVKK